MHNAPIISSPHPHPVFIEIEPQVIIVHYGSYGNPVSVWWRLEIMLENIGGRGYWGLLVVEINFAKKFESKTRKQDLIRKMHVQWSYI